MKESKDSRVYLLHIADCLRKIERDTQGGRDAFWSSETIQDAVIRNLQVMCESTQKLPASWKQARPEVDWRLVSDFRNRLVHDYLGIDLDIVWKVVEEDLPVLRRAIFAALAAPGSGVRQE